ncbi:MAG TPA: hypothetical protein VMT54_12610 [Candidatus Cybelea sp.]|nr:hypothetical protein [Candidatus Cybelea sp.]
MGTLVGQSRLESWLRKNVRRSWVTAGSDALAQVPDPILTRLIREALLQLVVAVAVGSAFFVLLDLVTWYFGGMHRAMPSRFTIMAIVASSSFFIVWRRAVAYHIVREMEFRRMYGKWRWER